MKPAARQLGYLATSLMIGVLLLSARNVSAEESKPDQLEGVDVAERLGSRVPLKLTFTDHQGRTVRLGDYINGEMPVLLSLNYYQCPMLCNLQLNGLIKGLKELGWPPGEKFRMVTISIDPQESVSMAAEKRKNYLESLGLPGGEDWNFLVGNQEAIQWIADSVGYRYRYLEEEGQYAHIPVLFFLSPGGTITRYLYGLEYKARDLKFALVDSAEGKVGTTVDRILLSCFQYDEKTGQYTPFAYGIMRLGGATTLLGLVFFLFWLFRRDRQRSTGPEAVT